MKNEKPRISVVVPTFNRCHALPKALNSVLRQSVQPIEIIVIDNNSQDNTLDEIRSNFPSIKLLVEKKQGVSAARNLGIRASIGNWVAFLDSDDEWLSNKLERQIEVCNNFSKSVRLIHTNEIWKKDNKVINQKKKHQKAGRNIFLACLSMCCISPSSVLLRKDVFEDLGYFDENLPACEDYDFWLRFCAKEDVFFIDENLIVKHGGHSDQLSRKYWAMDRFRVYSLEKLIITGDISLENKMASIKMLMFKLNVLIKGGLNRGNMPLIDFYSEKKNFWTNFVKDPQRAQQIRNVEMNENFRFYFE